MKKVQFSLAIAACLLAAAAMTGCLKDKCKATMTYQVWKPITKSIGEIRAGLTAAAPEPLKNAGQIYLYQNWLLVGELGRGIHVFDNTDPSNPVNRAFINLPGANDMAVRDGILLADNYIDLVAVDLADPLAPKLLSRVENVFPYNAYGDGYIVGYEITDETVTVDCDSPNYGLGYYYLEDGCEKCDFTGGPIAVDVNSASAPPVTGVAGSTARFTIAGERLYTVDWSSLHAFDISDVRSPRAVGQPVQVDFHVETLFSMDKKLFVGSNNGTFFYDVETNPDNPVKLGEFIHVRSCDPVVTDGETAFITLHDGSECLGFANQLDVVDVKDLTKPIFLKTFPMTHPLGLGVRGDLLFVCDDGVKVFDKKDPATVGDRLVGQIGGIEATDLIPVPWSTDLIVRSPKGIYQFDASNPADLRQRSLIEVVK